MQNVQFGERLLLTNGGRPIHVARTKLSVVRL